MRRHVTGKERRGNFGYIKDTERRDGHGTTREEQRQRINLFDGLHLDDPIAASFAYPKLFRSILDKDF